jgi:hypothetical protein
MEWVAEVHVQIGPTEEPPQRFLRAFLAGFIAGVEAHGARDAALLDVPDDLTMYANPGCRIGYRLDADDEAAAQRIADDEFFPAGLRSGVAAVPPQLREFGWMASTKVRRG